jgi:hypothetical protein
MGITRVWSIQYIKHIRAREPTKQYACEGESQNRSGRSLLLLSRLSFLFFSFGDCLICLLTVRPQRISLLLLDSLFRTCSMMSFWQGYPQIVLIDNRRL